jgi:hypothetical protein
MITIINANDDLYWREIAAFEIFDTFLDFCCKNICPKIELSKDTIDTLTDISIDKYVHQKAFYYYEDHIGMNDNERYYQALDRINCVLSCAKEPIIKDDVFKKDTDQILKNSGSNNYNNARKRKAFWSHLCKKNNPNADYFDAHNFIEEVHRISTKPETGKDDLNRIKEVLRNKVHIANALDLYRVCIIRKKLLSINNLFYSKNYDFVKL